MKILHYSDRVSQEFSALYESCDVLVTTGDLTFFDLNPIESKINKKPAFGVYGNHDSGQYMEELGIINLHNQVYDYDGLKWGGFQGSIKYKDSGIMYTEEDAKNFADNFPYVDVLLLHAGPKDMLDDNSDFIHTGSEHIRRYVLEKKPKYVFVGHQYSDDELTVDRTKIFRTYGARTIEI
jgi:Icc-related predicted phosphoesterase